MSDHSIDDPEESGSFGSLIASHQGRLLGYIRSLVPDPHLARDVLQETNMVMLRKERDFKPGSNFAAWAFRVAYFEVLTWRRRCGRDRLVFSDEVVASIAEKTESMADLEERRRDALLHCLEKLPERQRGVIQQRYLDGASVAAIAQEQGLEANAVSQLLFRARRSLARCVDQRLGQSQAATNRPSSLDKESSTRHQPKP